MTADNKFTFFVSGSPMTIMVPPEENAVKYLKEGEEILKKHFDDYETNDAFKTISLDKKMTLVAFSIAYELAKGREFTLSSESLEVIKGMIDLVDQITELE
jgi:hypothetical protein